MKLNSTLYAEFSRKMTNFKAVKGTTLEWCDICMLQVNTKQKSYNYTYLSRKDKARSK